MLKRWFGEHASLWSWLCYLSSGEFTRDDVRAVVKYLSVYWTFYRHRVFILSLYPCMYFEYDLHYNKMLLNLTINNDDNNNNNRPNNTNRALNRVKDQLSSHKENETDINRELVHRVFKGWYVTWHRVSDTYFICFPLLPKLFITLCKWIRKAAQRLAIRNTQLVTLNLRRIFRRSPAV